MTTDVLTGITWGFGTFAFCTAVFNLWVFWMRPRDPAHLWLGVMSLGVVWLSGAFAASYQAHTLESAQAWVTSATVGTLPFAVAMQRFSELFAGIRNLVLRAAIPYLAIGVCIALAAPQLYFTGNAIEVRAEGLVSAYLVPELSLAATVFLAPFAIVVGVQLHAFRRAAPTIHGGALISAALMAFGACLVNDLCVVLGTHWAPFLSPLGFGLFSGAFGAVLLRRLVRSQRHLERSAAELNALIDARTEELRRKDLELAHGARLSTLGALAGGIAAQIESPLAEVAGHVKILRDAWHAPSRRDAAREPLAHAQRGIERIRIVVAELLQLARREQGATGRHDLAAIVARVLPVASYELTRRARLHTSLASAPPVHGDSAMLAQITLHLIVGAIQASPESGDGPTPVVSIETGEREGHAYLAVTDNGAPLSTAAGAGLFDPATRLDGDSRTASYAVTRQLVERHGGAFAIESTAAGNRVVVEFAPVSPEPGS
ncbi:MAG: hypothetical protein FJ091_11175 [Deltaproteobacteria bacterium]|nr:hypothetical protein [Deltaproteobacteria bacterium]